MPAAMISDYQEGAHIMFYVYEDGPSNMATIHMADCPWCKHGEGLVRDSLNENSKWWGEFVTFDGAAFIAHNTGKLHRLCKRCKPGEHYLN